MKNLLYALVFIIAIDDKYISILLDKLHLPIATTIMVILHSDTRFGIRTAQ
jgi:hypothetical protein